VADAPRFVLTDVPMIPRLFRFQGEPSQEAHVLLYPEGMVKLNQSAGEILKRVDGRTPLSDIVADLERTFNQPDLKQDVLQFMEVAYDKGWVRARKPE
jgi:pyrroloquinoline quinone biosynthesis protein D